MISAAQVIFRNRHADGCLDWLLQKLTQSGVSCSATEWQGYSTVVPQILVPTKPVSMTIQVDDDPQYVPEEIQEVADEVQPLLPEAVHRELTECDTRLDIMSTNPPKRTETDDAVTIWAQTDLDPLDPEVERILVLLSNFTRGFIVDCVNGRLRAPDASNWLGF